MVFPNKKMKPPPPCSEFFPRLFYASSPAPPGGGWSSVSSGISTLIKFNLPTCPLLTHPGPACQKRGKGLCKCSAAALKEHGPGGRDLCPLSIDRSSSNLACFSVKCPGLPAALWDPVRECVGNYSENSRALFKECKTKSHLPLRVLFESFTAQVTPMK